MDRALKERIIGAIVLVAVVVLVVPVFLDGPSNDADIVSQPITLPGQAADGTRTVVLDRDRREPVPMASDPEPVAATPPPVEASAADEPEAPIALEPAPAPVTDESATAVTASEAPADEPEAADEQEAADEPEAAAEPERQAAAPTRSTTGMWAVQLGSFSNEANAERLAAGLRQQGFAAFLSKLDTDNGQLHRVRVGPQRDRESAETMAGRLKQAGHKGQVVPHP